MTALDCRDLISFAKSYAELHRHPSLGWFSREAGKIYPPIVEAFLL